MNTLMGSNATDHQSLDQYDDEIDLRELFGVLWAGKDQDPRYYS